MDVVGLIKNSYSNYGTFISDSWYKFLYENVSHHIAWTLTIGFLVAAFLYALHAWKKHQLRKQTERSNLFARDGIQVGASGSGSRFRKRDKMLFYGRRMLRKVKSISGQAYGGQGRKRRAVMRFAKRLLQLRNDNAPTQLKVVEPPAEYLEESIDGHEKVPSDALYMLQSIRIFGQFEKPVFLKICKHTEILNLKAGDHLIKIGDSDDSVFIVQSGLVNVNIINADGSTMALKSVRTGESVTSLLSFIDVLVGNISVYKTVSARAVEDSQIIRLPLFALKEVFDESPDILVRVVQVIMIRLQRVTITALHQYLGLNTETVLRKKTQTQQPQHQSAKASPGHRRHASDQVVQLSQSERDQRPDMLNDLSDAHACPSVALINRRQSVYVVNNEPVDDSVLENIAIDGLMKELGLKESDRYIIEENMKMKELQAGETIVHQGRVDEISLIYVITGGLFLIQYTQPVNTSNSAYNLKKTDNKGSHEAHSILLNPGEIAGGLAVLTGESSIYTVRAKYFSKIGYLTKDAVYNVMRERPRVVVYIANSVVSRLTPLVRQCDFALDWIFLESGRAVYRQDEPSDSTYIILNGRLRSVITQPNGKKEIVGEFGKGDLVGVVEMITETPRTTTVMAVRDSELAKLPEGLFNAIKFKHPVVVTQLISLLSHRILGSLGMGGPRSNAAMPLEKSQAKVYSTVAILAVSDDVPLTAFTYELYHSLCAIGSTVRLTSEVVRKTLGPNIMDLANEFRLTSWLAQQEDRNNIALYQCDPTLDLWTQRCLRQADVVLIVGLGEKQPTISKLEREIDRLAIRTAKELILLHDDSSTVPPSNTVLWLNMRAWVTKHHHIQCPKRMFTRRSQYRINDLYSKVLMSEPNIHSDFSRLARWLTGNSVGLVLGGGGARGAAHVGMIKSIQEAGIPIDMVGGVSIGAFMGALWCSEKNVTTLTQKAREWCYKMTHWGRQILDLTYPMTSMFSGRDFNQTIRSTFGDLYIEDLWLPYFTLTTDISASCARIHTHGSLWRYIRSSMSLSGYMPPLCDPKDGHLLLDGGYVNNLPGILWRYVRASMSVAGIMPPLCDQKDGHLLLDGCYANNVPADVMRAQGAAHIIAIDVGSQDETDLTDYGDDLSGWWLLYKRWNPFTSPVKVPDLPDIQSRLAYVSCVRQLEEVKNSDYCEYIRPPIDQYKTLDFACFDEIKDVGYVHGKNYFINMAKHGRLSKYNAWRIVNSDDPIKQTLHTFNEYKFIDLAQIVCKLPETHNEMMDSDTSDDDEDMRGYASEPSNIPYNSAPRKMRTGGSLSLSENEIDSDDLDEIPVPQHLRHAKAKSPESRESSDRDEISKKSTSPTPTLEDVKKEE